MNSVPTMPPHPPLAANPTRAWLIWLLVLLALLGLYASTALAMERLWAASDTYAHGYVVPLIALWLGWRQRARLVCCLPQPSVWGCLGLAGAGGLWLAGDLVAVNAATQLALVLMVVASVPAVLGWQVARVLAFPLGFLLFAVPMGDFLLPTLMSWTADFTVLALRFSGIPVYREGLQFVIPSGNWSVVEACSGIRYLIASITVGCLFAYLSYQGWRKRLLFVAVAVAVPLLANWLRAYLIVLLGHLSGNTLATGVDHLIYGWLFFGVVIGLMFLIGARWADAPATPVAAAPATGAVPVPGSLPRTLPVWLGAVVAVAVLLWPLAAGWVLRQSVHAGPVQWVAPAPAPGWQALALPPSDWAPAFVNPTAQWQRGYRGPGGETVGLHLSYYRQQGYDRKLVTSVNELVRSNDTAWSRTRSGTAMAPVAGHTVPVQAAELRQGNTLASTAQRLQVWRLYWVGGRLTASDAHAKILGALGLLQGRGDDGALVVLYTLRQPDDLDAFLRAHGSALLASLQAAQAEGR